MGDFFYITGCILLVLACVLAVCAAVVFTLGFLKYMRYFNAIYKHPEIFGDPLMIPWEKKKLIIETMQKRTESAVRHLHPDNKKGFELKIYTQ